MHDLALDKIVFYILNILCSAPQYLNQTLAHSTSTKLLRHRDHGKFKDAVNLLVAGKKVHCSLQHRENCV